MSQYLNAEDQNILLLSRQYVIEGEEPVQALNIWTSNNDGGGYQFTTSNHDAETRQAENACVTARLDNITLNFNMEFPIFINVEVNQDAISEQCHNLDGCGAIYATFEGVRADTNARILLSAQDIDQDSVFTNYIVMGAVDEYGAPLSIDANFQATGAPIPNGFGLIAHFSDQGAILIAAPVTEVSTQPDFIDYLD